MKIKYEINANIELITQDNPVMVGDLVLCTKHVYNNPKKGQEAKKIIFSKNSNYTVTDKIMLSKISFGFVIINSVGTALSIYYNKNEEDKTFYKYVKKV